MKPVGLRHLIVRLVLILAVFLGLAGVLAPVAWFTEDVQDEDSVRVPLNVFQAFVHHLSAEPESFGSVEAHPYAISGGLALARIGVTVILVAGVALVLLASRLSDNPVSRVSARLVTVATLGLILGVVLTCIGERWLPDDGYDMVEPGFGLWFSLAVAVWLLHAAWSLTEPTE